MDSFSRLEPKTKKRWTCGAHYLCYNKPLENSLVYSLKGSGITGLIYRFKQFMERRAPQVGLFSYSIH